VGIVSSSSPPRYRGEFSIIYYIQHHYAGLGSVVISRIL
jgi:hypothetical protein